MTKERETGQESRPADYNSKAVDAKHPAKTDQASYKIDINESGLGRSQGQSPAEEHMEPAIGQIDKKSADTYNDANGDQANPNDSDADDTHGYMNDAASADRDTGNGTDNWDQNNSRTARHK